MTDEPTTSFCQTPHKVFQLFLQRIFPAATWQGNVLHSACGCAHAEGLKGVSLAADSHLCFLPMLCGMAAQILFSPVLSLGQALGMGISCLGLLNTHKTGGRHEQHMKTSCSFPGKHELISLLPPSPAWPPGQVDPPFLPIY